MTLLMLHSVSDVHRVPLLVRVPASLDIETAKSYLEIANALADEKLPPDDSYTHRDVLTMAVTALGWEIIYPEVWFVGGKPLPDNPHLVADIGELIDKRIKLLRAPPGGGAARRAGGGELVLRSIK